APRAADLRPPLHRRAHGERLPDDLPPARRHPRADRAGATWNGRGQPAGAGVTGKSERMNRSDDGMDASASARVDDTAAQPAAECPERFAIPAASSLHERRPRTLKHGDTFAVFDHSSDAIAGPGRPEGIYHRGTRYLSHFRLTLCDARPILLSSSLRDDNVARNCDLSN